MIDLTSGCHVIRTKHESSGVDLRVLKWFVCTRGRWADGSRCKSRCDPHCRSHDTWALWGGHTQPGVVPISDCDV